MKTSNDNSRTDFDSFTRTVEKILSVSKDEILRREAEYKKRSDANPKKRGPKKKETTS